MRSAGARLPTRTPRTLLTAPFSRLARRFVRLPPSSTEDQLAGPIRGELLGAEHLAERARSLGSTQRVARGRRARVGVRDARLLTRLTSTRRILDDAHARLAAASLRQVDIGPAGEWLLDNFHVVQEHVRQVHESLPRDYYRELPQLAAGPLAGYPRVYELVIALISHTEGRIDIENVDLFVDAYQEASALTIGELWAVPAMLRLGLIESIRRMTLRTLERLTHVERAEAWVERIQAAHGGPPDALGAVLSEFVSSPPDLQPVFVSRFLSGLRLSSGAFPPIAWLEQWIAEEAMSADEATVQATQRLALTKLMMSNSITSLRGLGQRDWRAFVERQSLMERALRTGDPARVYAGMTFATRDAYRHAVERIARRTRHTELEVVRCALELARTDAPDGAGDPRRQHVGYWLIDRGVPDLEAELGYRPTPLEAIHRWVLRHPAAVYVTGVAAATVGAVAAVLWLAGAEARTAWLAVVALTLIPAADIAVNLINQLVTILLPPRVLPRLDLQDDGVPEQYRTAVVVPTLLASVEAVRETLGNLEVQYLANREKHLHFAVLSDFTDAAAATMPGDDAILAAAEEGIRALNERYGAQSGAGDTFLLFHRDRLWNARERVWMGWERKRGKLAQFNRYVRGAAGDAFSLVVGRADVLRGVRYVITLDADTLLPPETAAALIGAIAHPLNRARYDERSGRVLDGYGILQPRVGVSVASAQRSRFASINSGHPGVDPYTTAVSDVYQDLFGEGSYTGKGIYDVDAFERATHGRFPENTLLSHDLIEGNYARAGLATDISVFDDYPSSYLTYSRRKHRWIRGDWQLLQWLTGTVPGPDGPEPNRLSILSRWKIFDNLRRSLVEPSLLALLIAGWTALPGSALRWTLLVIGAVAAPWIIALLLAAVRFPGTKSWREYYRAVGQDAVTSLEQFALAMTFLAHQAWLSADAILRTLWRLYVSRRHLLEWQAAALAERMTAGTLGAYWRAMRGSVVLVLVAAIAVMYAGGWRSSLVAAVAPLSLLWIAAPAVARRLGRPRQAGAPPLDEPARTQALRYAERHWAYFDQFVSATTHWLAPDNFQEDPVPTVAMRTSPTNIGLQLLSTVSAHDLGFISTADMTERLERAFATFGRLERYRGHFYNWYDLSSLRVLEPAYVSTVDSGNLAGHLLALRQACLTLGRSDGASPELSARLLAIADLAEWYAMDMDFGFLYDSARDLFTIGYHTATHAPDVSHYDLLASEARLASFVAVAKGDVPVEHWFRLGRTLTHAAGDAVLLSWSGSMFEYLMPSLVMRAYHTTVLGRTLEVAIERQIAWGAERGVPWGTSESAYHVRDRHLTYQYRAFGVPDLGLKRGLGREVVVAPYASALAALIDPGRALANLAVLEDKGALGQFGFVDALDYTRPPKDSRFALVRTYMAHHVGMTIVALTNVLRANVWQRRFHRDPVVRSVSLLLDERVPRRLTVAERQDIEPHESLPEPMPDRPVVRVIETPDTRQPHIAMLGQAPLTVMISHAGAGATRYEDLAVTRWRSDGTLDNTGQFCYLKDVGRQRVWSAAHQPVAAPADWYRALLATDRVTFHRADNDIETRTEIVVVPADCAEVRVVTVTNNGAETREIELTSYGEIVMAPAPSDRSHPAFSNLFVETEWHDWCSAITAKRRPRSAGERELWCVHVVDAGKNRVGPVTCQTSRAEFVGRGRSTRDPVALERDGALGGTTGAVLDPIFALRTRVRLARGESASVAFTTLVTTSREGAFELADRYHEPHSSVRARDLAWTMTRVELQELDLTPADAAVYQDLGGFLLYPSAALRAPRDEILRNRGSQQELWAHGISGDWPIVLATIDLAAGLHTLQQVFAMHRYWRRRGMIIDLVVLVGEPHSYQQDLNDRVTELLLAMTGGTTTEGAGGVFLRRRQQVSARELEMISATSRLHITCDGRSLARMLGDVRHPADADIDDAEEEETPVPRMAERSTPPSTSVVQRLRTTAATVMGIGRPPGDVPAPAPVRQSARPASSHANGFGELTRGASYRISVRGDVIPPAPWTNVIANRQAGCLVTERGMGATWACNSYFYRLTPWHNDPVSDPPADVLYIQDAETRELWSATPAPIRSGRAFDVEHEPGQTTFVHEHADIGSELAVGMAADDPVRLAVLRLTNHGSRPRRLAITAYVEWTLGVLREHTQHQVVTAWERERGAILARNYFAPQFAGWVAFAALSERPTGHTGDRREFLGRNGSLADPVALRQGSLSGTTGAALDPCAALQCHIELAPGETRAVVLQLGAAAEEAEARRLIDRYRDVANARAALDEVARAWTARLSVIRVKTPEPTFDAMLNTWTLYQALSCRMWGRTALYQSGGAYGFRDQLQDVMAFVYAEPGEARAHIVRAAGRQFQEGDVQHWWHPDSGRGVRTRFSDDLVWLPLVADHYVRVTGDASVLDEEAPFLEMRPLAPDEHEVYDLPTISTERATVYEHCRRALDRACTTGPHGLPLIGSGDWNDGMNRVGVHGRGESVWMAWFLITTLRAFADRAEARGDTAVAIEMRGRATAYQAAAEAEAWDGAWYRRAWFDDGTPLGSVSNTECRIDSIAQTWSVISGAGDPTRQERAMRSLEEFLVDDEARIMRLLTPPFDKAPYDPGYIRGYVPGVRENGAQYTHAALWVVLATAIRGHGARAFELFQMINPLTRTRTPEDVARYKVEPYVVAADIYATENELGRGGWTWYTGSASWTYRVGLEAILGFRKEGDRLWIEPCVPPDWPEVTIDYRFGASRYHIVVKSPEAVGRLGGAISLDGQRLDPAAVPLVNDGREHEVMVVPRPQPA